MTAATDMLRNRLRKNIARLKSWAAREGVEAWRVYDRDIPEFPWTIDRYGDHALAQEFVSPVARRQTEVERIAEREAVLGAIQDALGIPPERIHIRERVRHGPAVRPPSRGNEGHEFEIRERGHRFLVNLEDYLDTGLFLDHRNARRMVGRQSSGKRVLNLFCYTGSFSVYAAKAGASRVTSVDLSSTYLAWAERNFRLNGIDPQRHPLVRADVFDFLRNDREHYDLVVLDPPTLSRSRSGRSFDVQASHVELVNLSLARLAPGGTLIFSTNYRRFVLDERRLKASHIREITRETVPEDFRGEIHRCWELSGN